MKNYIKATFKKLCGLVTFKKDENVSMGDANKWGEFIDRIVKLVYARELSKFGKNCVYYKTSISTDGEDIINIPLNGTLGSDKGPVSGGYNNLAMQINLKDLPYNNTLPRTGVLQLWGRCDSFAKWVYIPQKILDESYKCQCGSGMGNTEIICNECYAIVKAQTDSLLYKYYDDGTFTRNANILKFKKGKYMPDSVESMVIDNIVAYILNECADEYSTFDKEITEDLRLDIAHAYMLHHNDMTDIGMLFGEIPKNTPSKTEGYDMMLLNIPSSYNNKRPDISISQWYVNKASCRKLSKTEVTSINCGSLYTIHEHLNESKKG